NRRLRIGLGGIAALLIAGALVAPVVDRGGSTKACSMALSYRGGAYAVRPTRDNALVQAVAIGAGVVHGCGLKPQNVNLRSLLGIPPAAAVALEGDQTSIYIRRGVCPHAAARALVSCLKR
ncbi:MAG: hypothetical protein ACRDNM_10990, partial [Gaiellaceae bacterium]